MQSERVIITLDADLAWIGEAPELIEHQPSKLEGNVEAGLIDLVDKADAMIFRQAWSEMQDSE